MWDSGTETRNAVYVVQQQRFTGSANRPRLSHLGTVIGKLLASNVCGLSL